MWQKVLKKVLSHVIVHVTNRCDCACGACFVRKGNLDLALESARLISAKLGRITWLDIGGGEPFLHHDLVALCRSFDTRSITIPTNGQQTERICETVRHLRDAWRGELTIAISLDGFEADNDASRGAGTFQRAVATFNALRKTEGLIVKVNTVVSQATIKNLIPFMGFVRRDLVPDYHSLLLLRGRPASEAYALPSLEELTERTPAIFEIWRSYAYADKNPLRRRLKGNFQRYSWRTSLKTITTGRCHVPCQAPYLHKVIYPDGSISMCELMPAIGNVLEDSVEVLNSRMENALKAYEGLKGPCFCTHNCNMADNILVHPKSIARILTGRTDA